jgi:hypothetical protein
MFGGGRSDMETETAGADSVSRLEFMTRITSAFDGYVVPPDSADYRSTGIRFTPSGDSRLASIVGYIVGTAEAGNTRRAWELAVALISTIKRIADSNGIVPGVPNVPYRITVLDDDGTRMSWAVTSYIAACAEDCDPQERRLLKDDSGAPLEITTTAAHHRYAFRYVYEGRSRLVYQGPANAEEAQAQVDAVRPCWREAT